MPNCLSCSAPLPSDTSLCSYCGTRNDMDLSALKRYAVSRSQSTRYCPDCDIPLTAITLDVGDQFVIERCECCFGVFFDPGEVQTLLEASVASVFEINYQQIVNISRERGSQKRPVRYIKCPECGKLMNRIAFGYRSGVIVDQCRAHGVWLDNGELIQLMEWKRAGGELLGEQRAPQRRAEADTVKKSAYRSPPTALTSASLKTDATSPEDSLDELVTSAVNFIGRLFR